MQPRSRRTLRNSPDTDNATPVHGARRHPAETLAPLLLTYPPVVSDHGSSVNRETSSVATSSRAARSGPKAGARASARPAAQRPLGNYAKTAATAGQGPDEKRAEKYRALRQLLDVTTLPRLRKCKRVSMLEGGGAILRDGVRASIAGLVSCGSVWACPVCSAKISASRAQELTKLVQWNADRGGSLALLTLTMRHHRGQTLPVLRKALTGAWRHISKGRAWTEIKKELDLDGYVRAIEVTDGDNGWHLHIHALLVFSRPVTDAEVAELEAVVWTLWSIGLARFGMTAIREHGIDVRRGEEALETFGGYISKIAFETVGARWKKGRKGGRTPFEILAEGLATGNADDLERWQEWEQGSKGLRQLTWSRGLKGRVGLDDVTDEELAEKQEQGVSFAHIPGPTLRSAHREGLEHVLDVIETDGRPGVFAWLDARGLAYTPLEEGLNGEDAEQTRAQVATRLRNGAANARRNERVTDLLERLDRSSVTGRN